MAATPLTTTTATSHINLTTYQKPRAVATIPLLLRLQNPPSKSPNLHTHQNHLNAAGVKNNNSGACKHTHLADSAPQATPHSIRIESKRIDMIKEIVKEFELVYNKLTNTELAIVSSVVPLEEQHLYGNSGSKLIDMSVKKQLEEIAAQLEIGDISLAV
ncbi:ATP synthase delta chain, chloroplastic-like protein [Tanacetum coccineum]